MAGSRQILNSSSMQLIFSCSLINFLCSPLDTSLVPIISVTVYIFVISSISSDANIWEVAAPEKLKIPTCQCAWSCVNTRIRLSPITKWTAPSGILGCVKCSAQEVSWKASLRALRRCPIHPVMPVIGTVCVLLVACDYYTPHWVVSPIGRSLVSC